MQQHKSVRASARFDGSVYLPLSVRRMAGMGNGDTTWQNPPGTATTWLHSKNRAQQVTCHLCRHGGRGSNLGKCDDDDDDDVLTFAHFPETKPVVTKQAKTSWWKKENKIILSMCTAVPVRKGNGTITSCGIPSRITWCVSPKKRVHKVSCYELFAQLLPV